MTQAASYLKIEGIPANSNVGWNGGDLLIPITSAANLQGGYVSPVAGKVGNSAEQDLSVNLVTYPLALDYSAGFGMLNYTPDARRYYTPSPNGTGDTLSDGPVAWTLQANAPILPGANWTQQNPARTFLQFEQFISNLYAIDTQTNRLLRENAGTWQYYTGTAWTTTNKGASISAYADNGSGLFRCTSNAHTLSNGDVVSITGATGASAPNGVWTVSNVAANTFDLTASTYGAGVSGGTWKCDAAGLSTTPTEIYARATGAVRMLMLGQGTKDDTTTYARISLDGTTWSNFKQKGNDQNAQHFCATGKILWFSTGAWIYENVDAGKQARSQMIGDANSPILGMVAAYDGITIAKKEGVFHWHINQDWVEEVYLANSRADLNGRLLLTHNQMVWFSANQALYAWDGSALRDQTFFSVEGNASHPFYHGHIVGGWSDGRKLFLTLRVTTQDTPAVYQYYVIIYTGAQGGYHPVFFVSSTTEPTGVESGAVILVNNKLYYAAARDSSQNDKIGYIKTNGEIPFGAFTRNVGITTGWWNGSRPVHTKWLKELHIVLRDTGTAKGMVRAYYKKWGDTTWTLIGETSAGSNSNAILPIPSDNQLGITGVLFQFKFVLSNVDTSPASAWYLREAYVIGRVYNEAVYNVAFSVPITSQDLNGITSNTRDDFNSVNTIAGLRAAIKYGGAVKLTHPDGSTYYGFVTQNATDRITQFNSDGNVIDRMFQCAFIEAA